VKISHVSWLSYFPFEPELTAFAVFDKMGEKKKWMFWNLWAKNLALCCFLLVLCTGPHFFIFPVISELLWANLKSSFTNQFRDHLELFVWLGSLNSLRFVCAFGASFQIRL
jgi:hypothetical protein